MIWLTQRGRWLLAMAVAGAISGQGVLAEQAVSPAKRPNVLWIGMDQLRPDALGCSGNRVCQTPNLDRLARQGVRFSNAYTTCCLCSPARASMLTGRFAFKHGMGTNCDLYHSLARELPHPEMLLHRRLAALGYNLGFVGKWHVGTQKGADAYGFEGLGPAGYGGIDKHPEFLKYLKDAGLSFGAVKHPITAPSRRDGMTSANHAAAHPASIVPRGTTFPKSSLPRP